MVGAEWKKLEALKKHSLALFALIFLCKTFSKLLKVGLLPSQTKKYFICFNESPLKMMKNAFYFILKTPFVLSRYLIFYLLFGYTKAMA